LSPPFDSFLIILVLILDLVQLVPDACAALGNPAVKIGYAAPQRGIFE